MSTNPGKTGAQPEMGEQPDQTPDSQMNLSDSVNHSQTAKSKADTYTTAPWAKRSELSQLAAPSESASSVPAAVPSSSSAQAIMQQLLACHATMRQQQQHINDLNLTNMRHQQRIDDLEEELRQCRKRERAGQEMFLQLFGENQKLCAERRRLDAKEDRLQRMFRVVRIGNKELEEEKTCLEHERMLFEANADPQSKKSDVEDENSAEEKREVGEINPFAVGMTSKQFRDKDLSRWNLNDAHRAKIVALRYRHEYYRGWLDAMRSHDDKEAFYKIKDGIKCELEPHPLNILEYMYNRAHPKHPFNAGFNAGLLFGWSALCDIHSLPQHDVRLDNRKWKFDSLLSLAPQTADHRFWDGMYEATEKMRQLFELKVKSGVWNHREDPAQMEILRPITESYGFDKQQEEARAARTKTNDLVWQWAERWNMQKAGVEAGEAQDGGPARNPEEPKNDEDTENNEKLEFEEV